MTDQEMEEIIQQRTELFLSLIPKKILDKAEVSDSNYITKYIDWYGVRDEHLSVEIGVTTNNYYAIINEEYYKSENDITPIDKMVEEIFPIFKLLYPDHCNS